MAGIGAGLAPAFEDRMGGDQPALARLVVNSVTKRAKSTCACWPGGVSKRTSNGLGAFSSLMAATNRFTAV